MNKYTHSASAGQKKGSGKNSYLQFQFFYVPLGNANHSIFFHSVAPVFYCNLGYTGSCLLLIKEISFSVSILYCKQQNEIVLNANSQCKILVKSL